MVAKKQTETMTFHVIDENHLKRYDFSPQEQKSAM